MSKRIDYLLKARPKAVGAYFEFLKESGRYLDDKTRFLISIVTKVASSTPSGIRQYVPHAIRAGASGQEIIDAILMSFPAAGLSKVLDAIAVIEEMDLPELRLENLDRSAEWHSIMPVSDLPKEKLIAKSFGGRDFILYSFNGAIKAYDRHCPHLGSRLPKKHDKEKLECKAHGWCFNLETGECTHKGDRALHAYKTRVVDGIVELNMLRID